MVTIISQLPVDVTPEVFENLKTKGATVEWIEPSSDSFPGTLPRYKINGIVCVLK